MFYNISQKIAVSLNFIPCIIICFILYLFSKKRLEYNETIGKRMQYFYGVTSSILLSHVLFVMILRNPVLPFLFFIGLGFFIIVSLQKTYRTWKVNDYTETANIDLYHIIDDDNVSVKSVYVEDNLASEDIPEREHILENEAEELKKRRLVVIVTIIVMTIIIFIDPMFLLSKTSALSIGMFWTSRCLQTIALCVAMIHAVYIGTRDGKWNWYLLVCITWCIFCIISVVPILIDYDVSPQSNDVLMFFYYVCAGVLLWVSNYFINIDRKETSVNTSVMRLVAFFIPMVLYSPISFFI